MRERSRAVSILAALVLMTAPPVQLRAEPTRPGWTDDRDAAFARARAETKPLLLDFTGSDWCAPCLRMNREIFGTPEFIAYAREKLVLLEVDFPYTRPQTLPLHLQNERLRREYGVEEFPAIIVLDANGKVLQTFAGYQAGGAKAFIRQLDKLK